MKMLIVDMDGTVVDSMPFLRELAIALVVADGHAEAQMRQLYDETFGRPISEQYAEWNRRYASAQGPINAQKLTRLYESVHLIAANQFPMTDFGRTLAAFRYGAPRDWRFALVTSTNKRIVDRMMQLRQIDWAFIGGYEGKGTEKREQILRAILPGVSLHHDVIYVGDSPSDRDLADDLGLEYHFPSGQLLATLITASVGV
jgi:phosphoglycolate phosphatase-like HAD superfamily hydrolase